MTTITEKFPSLKEAPVTIMSGLEASNFTINSPDFKNWDAESRMRDYYLCIPLVYIEKHCLDKEVVKEIIEKMGCDALCHPDADCRLFPEDCTRIRLLKELGLGEEK